MKTAQKLAQIAKQNHKSFKKGMKVYCDGKYSKFYPKGEYLLDCESTIPNHWYLKSLDGTKEYCSRNGVPESHLTIVKERSFQRKVRWASHQYVRYVIKRCKELAKQGYGSVEIKIDKTTDNWNVYTKQNENCYSHDFVVKLLQREGFELEKREDYYDAQSYILHWQVKPDFSDASKFEDYEDMVLQEKDWERNKLPQAPRSERIGIKWE